MDLSIFKKTRPFFDFLNHKSPQSPIYQAAMSLVSGTDFADFQPVIQSLCDDISMEWDMDFADLSGAGYAIDDVEKILTLDTYGHHPMTATPQVVLTMIEGLRMTRHYEWLDHSATRYHPETILKIARICTADAVTQTIAAAWCLRENGMGAAWKYCLAGQNSDMAACYARVMDRCEAQGHGIDQTDKEAQSLTFRTWFTDESRVAATDAQTLDWMDDVLECEGALGIKSIDSGTIVCLALQVGGRSSYLDQNTVRDMMTNPFYGAVDNAIHQAHLMQIIRDNQTKTVDGIPFRDPLLAARFVGLEII